MAGMMSGAKGMGAAKMRGKFPFKKKKKSGPSKAAKTELKGDEEVPSASEQEVPIPGKVRRRMVSESY